MAKGLGVSLCASKLQKPKSAADPIGVVGADHSLPDNHNRQMITPMTNVGVVLPSCSLSSHWVHINVSGIHMATPHPLPHQHPTLPRTVATNQLLRNICPTRITDTPIQCKKSNQEGIPPATSHVENLLKVFGGNPTLLLEEWYVKVSLSSSYSCS